MKHFICVAGNGRVFSSFNAPNRIAARRLRVGDYELIEVTESVVPGAQYWDGRQLVDMPPRPSDFHEFDYAAKAWALNEDAAVADLRQRRDELLAQTDWRVIRANEDGSPLVEPWRRYRQALRDITHQPDLNNIQWPQAPQEDA